MSVRRKGRGLAGVAAAALVVLGAGCTDLNQVWELDHARVLAVRLSAPGLAATDTATVDALVCDDLGVPSVAAPSLVSYAPGLAPAVASALAIMPPGVPPSVPAGGSWRILAGDAAALARARAAVGLPPEAPLEVQLVVRVVVAGQTLSALKKVQLGQRLANPATPRIEVDGQTPAEGAVALVGRSVKLTLLGAPADAELSFAWRTSTGTLTDSETAAAKLEIASGDERAGQVVVLVRDPVGGVAWATAALQVQ